MDPQGETAEDVWEDVVDAEGCRGWPTLSLGSTQRSGWGCWGQEGMMSARVGTGPSRMRFQGMKGNLGAWAHVANE